jgi:hypothetical protein
MKHKVYENIDELFSNFVKDNQDLLNDMGNGDIIDLDKISDKLNARCILHHPINAIYVGKINGLEGPMYMFLDCEFDKIYSYYDVE